MHEGYPRPVLQLQPGWWVRLPGTYDPRTGQMDPTPRWVEVASMQATYDRIPGQISRLRVVTFTDGSQATWPPTTDVETLTLREAKRAGLIPTETGGNPT